MADFYCGIEGWICDLEKILWLEVKNVIGLAVGHSSYHFFQMKKAVQIILFSSYPKGKSYFLSFLDNYVGRVPWISSIWSHHTSAKAVDCLPLSESARTDFSLHLIEHKFDIGMRIRSVNEGSFNKCKASHAYTCIF